ncbi:YfcC family protein [Fulvivirga lutimaris]|uniref:YfcC family protein n=1 Tax=Fulvivirga lutimaris TaxID=1819566 RepID=UPI0012BC0453|nr:Na+/H+ antiporter NhaC family protein [Fulvivirga lutimaris]MTI38851.1 YfcC family protein [Fulvivirga lutimaris]
MSKFPNAFVVIIAVILLAWILTYLVPQGEYQRITNPETGITQVVNKSYAQIDAKHLSAFDMFLAIPRGIIGRADVIVLILLLGGCFYIIEKTGAMSHGLSKLVGVLRGKEVLALVIVSAIFTAAGAAIGLQEEVIAMMPMLLIFGKSLGYDRYSTIYMSYGSTVIGSSFSPSNPFAVIIAQKEAGLPLLSGSELRLIFLIIAFIVWLIYLINYSNKNRTEKVEMASANEPLTIRSKIILLLMCITFGIVIYGLLQLDWGFNEMSASFFVLGLVSGLIGKLGVNGTGEAYISGFKEMIFAAMIIGFANSISLVLKDGMIIDSIVHVLFGPLQYLPPAFSAVIMMLSHSVLHFPLPSYSGQAILTMPILVPLSDLIGLTRQTCVLAYQYGAVMGDMFVPTNGAMMAVLAISNISYNKWLKFIFKPTLLIMLLAAVSIIISVVIGYS